MHSRCRRVGRRKTTLAFLFARSPLAVGMPTQILMTRCTMTHVERAQRPYTSPIQPYSARVYSRPIQDTAYTLYSPIRRSSGWSLGRMSLISRSCVCAVWVLSISCLRLRPVQFGPWLGVGSSGTVEIFVLCANCGYRTTNKPKQRERRYTVGAVAGRRR